MRTLVEKVDFFPFLTLQQRVKAAVGLEHGRGDGLHHRFQRAARWSTLDAVVEAHFFDLLPRELAHAVGEHVRHHGERQGVVAAHVEDARAGLLGRVVKPVDEHLHPI